MFLGQQNSSLVPIDLGTAQGIEIIMISKSYQLEFFKKIYCHDLDLDIMMTYICTKNGSIGQSVQKLSSGNSDRHTDRHV